MTVIKEHSNQIVKILICLCLTFVFIFVQPKENTQQAEAILPILLWGGGILAGVVAEELLEMGVKHVTADGKTSKKSKSKKIADEILGNLDGYDFDDTNPTRRADGSLDVNLSANDRAKIARKIADEFGEVIDDDMARRTTNANPSYDYDGTDSADPMYQTSIGLDVLQWDSSLSFVDGVNFFKRFMKVEFEPVPFEKRTLIKVKSAVTGALVFETSKAGSLDYDWYPFYTTAGCVNVDTFPDGSRDFSKMWSYNGVCDAPTKLAYTTYKNVMAMANTEMHYGGGLAIPATLKKVYPVGEGYNGSLPNSQDLSNKPYKIKNFFPSSESDSDVTWETVQNHYDTDVTNNQTKIDNEYETYLENGDLNKNTYNTQTINNYYTDTNYPVKADDIRIDIDIDNDVTVPTVPGGTDVDVDGFKYCVEKSSGQVVPCKDIEGIDGGLLAYVRDSYNYAVNAVKTAVNGLETIATGSVGLIALYSEIFDWLPDEVTVLLTSGLMLMIGLRVFRK